MFLKSIFCTILILASLGLVRSQVPHFGACPEVKTQEDFDVDRYMGTWYEYEKYPFIFEMGKKCNYAVYGNEGNGTISIMNASIDRKTGRPSNITGFGKVKGPGKIAVEFHQRHSENPNYLVLATDYSSYSVVFHCKQLTRIGNTQVLWVLTRVRKPEDSIVLKARKVIEGNQLSTHCISKTDQELCPEVVEKKIVEAEVANVDNTNMLTSNAINTNVDNTNMDETDVLAENENVDRRNVETVIVETTTVVVDTTHYDNDKTNYEDEETTTAFNTAKYEDLF